jgi:ribosomal protein S12 methylthiotransferase accessory factor YcaO
MESIELYHAEYRVPLGRGFAFREALRHSDFLDPTLLPIRSDADFRLHRVIEWIEARSINDERTVLVPRELIDRDSRISTLRDKIFCSSSNGLASGKHEPKL